MGYISQRALNNVQGNELQEIRSYCFHNQYDRDRNPDGIVALAIAENKLMRAEMVAHINENMNITPWHLTYGQGPTGARDLRTTLAKFVNEVFHPSISVTADHLCICNGAGSAVDNLAFCFAEPGDGILIGRPLYVGFFPDMEARAQVKPVLVSFGDVDPTSAAAVHAYEEEFHRSQAAGVPIRAVLIASPHNPLGRPYDDEFLQGVMRFCSRHRLHLISDEVYARSHFPSRDFPHPRPFVSVLSFPLEQYINPGLVHVIYAMSKDFCANGTRIGAVISPFNTTLMRTFRAVASFTRASQLAEHAWLNVLRDSAFLDWYFPLFQLRMTDAYEYAVSVLRQHKIPYTPASVTSFIWIDLSRYLTADTQEAELALNWRMARAGVWLAMGASFASEKHGNYRLTFATPRDELTLGLERLIQVLQQVQREQETSLSV